MREKYNTCKHSTGNVKKYRCKKSFYVDKYDNDGFLIEDDGMVIEEGETYTLDDSGHTIVGGDVHLDREDGLWLEISREHLTEFFEEVE